MSTRRLDEFRLAMSRRHFFNRCGVSLGTAALASMLSEDGLAEPAAQGGSSATAVCRIAAFRAEGEAGDLPVPIGRPVATGPLRLQATARELRGQDLPDSVRRGQRLTGMTATRRTFPTAPSIYKFAQHGKSGATLSELLPHTAKIADDLCFIKSMHTEPINHDPAITFSSTGFQLAGRPSMGSWIAYGLGSENKDLPAFVVMVSLGSVERPAALRPAVGQRFSALALSGREVPHGARSGAVPVESRRGYDRKCGAGCSTIWRKLNQKNAETSAIRRSSPASRSTSWRTACRRRCRN